MILGYSTSLETHVHFMSTPVLMNPAEHRETPKAISKFFLKNILPTSMESTRSSLVLTPISASPMDFLQLSSLLFLWTGCYPYPPRTKVQVSARNSNAFSELSFVTDLWICIPSEILLSFTFSCPMCSLTHPFHWIGKTDRAAQSPDPTSKWQSPFMFAQMMAILGQCWMYCAWTSSPRFPSVTFL